jgi:hypothetical protein
MDDGVRAAAPLHANGFATEHSHLKSIPVKSLSLSDASSSSGMMMLKCGRRLRC